VRGESAEQVISSSTKSTPYAHAFELLFENANDAIYILDIHGNFVAANKKAEELTGFKREDFIGKSFRKIIPVKSFLKAMEGFLAVTRGKSIRLELELKTAAKDTIPVELTSAPLIINGKIVGTFGIVRDISERKKSEEALEKSEEMFRTLMEEAPISICNTDLKGKITFINKRFEEAMGYSREELVGKNGFKIGIMSDETLKSFKKRMKERLMGKPSRILEGQFKRKDGEWICAEVESRVIKKFGFPVGFQLIAKDITERKKAEEEGKFFEEKLSALNTYSQKLNMARNMEEIYRLTLDATEKLLGFEIAFFMVVDKGMLCVVDHRGYPEGFSVKLPLDGSRKGVSVKVARTGQSINVPDAEKNPDWVEFWPGIRSGLDVPVKFGDKVLGVIGVDSKSLNAFDEKDQKLVEILASHAATAMSNLEHARNLEIQAREIRESQEKFERLFMDNPEAVVYVGPDFLIVDANPRFVELFGYPLDEIRGRHIDDVVVPNDKIEEAKMVDRKALEGSFYHETVRKRKDGSLFPVSIAVASIKVEGKHIGAVGIYRDITKRKEMEKKLEEYSQHLEELVDKRTRELKEAQRQLLKAERLAAIGELAAMVGHDLRNPLTGIEGAAYYLKIKLGSKVDSKISEMLGLIERNIEYSNNIITDLLEYSREIRLETRETSPKLILKEALSLVNFPENIKVIDMTQSKPKIKVDVERMQRVFVNIIKNAIDAMPQGGTLRITSKQSNSKLEFNLTDTGVGMTEEVLEELWTPLFTTKAKGMGLGLPICKRIVEAHEGKIFVKSKVNEGTTFTVAVPIKLETEGGENAWLKPSESLLSTTTKA